MSEEVDTRMYAFLLNTGARKQLSYKLKTELIHRSQYAVYRQGLDRNYWTSFKHVSGCANSIVQQ